MTPDYRTPSGADERSVTHDAEFHAGPLGLAERQSLVACDHTVVRCEECGLHHRFFELVAERFCARCRRDVTPELRRHARDCDAPNASPNASRPGMRDLWLRRHARRARVIPRRRSRAYAVLRGTTRSRHSAHRRCPVCRMT